MIAMSASFTPQHSAPQWAPEHPAHRFLDPVWAGVGIVALAWGLVMGLVVVALV
jgi:hypothetical protein